MPSRSGACSRWEPDGGSDSEGTATGRRAVALSLRERQVIELATAGLSTRSIALRLTLSERTIENHLARIYAKLEVHSRRELIAHMARVTSAAG